MKECNMCGKDFDEFDEIFKNPPSNRCFWCQAATDFYLFGLTFLYITKGPHTFYRRPFYTLGGLNGKTYDINSMDVFSYLYLTDKKVEDKDFLKQRKVRFVTKMSESLNKKDYEEYKARTKAYEKLETGQIRDESLAILKNYPVNDWIFVRVRKLIDDYEKQLDIDPDLDGDGIITKKESRRAFFYKCALVAGITLGAIASILSTIVSLLPWILSL